MTRPRRVTLLVALALMTGGFGAPAQTNAASELDAAIPPYIAPYVQEHDFAGVVLYALPSLRLLVSQDGAGLVLANVNDGMKLPLDAIAPGNFFFRPLYAYVNFEANQRGIVHMNWNGSFSILKCPCPGGAAAARDAVVSGQRVKWAANPSICVDAPGSLHYLGSLDFALSDSAGERYVFAQTMGSSISRMIVVQAEHMLSDIDKYRYALSPGISIAGVPFKTNVFVFSNALEVLKQPESEAVATARFLKDRALNAADQWLAVRYATYDTAGRNEFMVFYMEPADPDKVDLTNVGPSDLPVFSQAFLEIRERADATVRIGDCQ